MGNILQSKDAFIILGLYEQFNIKWIYISLQTEGRKI